MRVGDPVGPLVDGCSVSHMNFMLNDGLSMWEGHNESIAIRWKVLLMRGMVIIFALVGHWDWLRWHTSEVRQ